VDSGRDIVPAVMALRLPRAADPAAVEAVLTRAMADADPPIAAELAWLPLLRAPHPGDPPVLTCALIVRPGPPVAGRDHRDVLASAKRAAKKALKRTFGPGSKVAIQAAHSPDTLAACSRAIAGNPRAVNPSQVWF
jgi:hypothetical protein